MTSILSVAIQQQFYQKLDTAKNDGHLRGKQVQRVKKCFEEILQKGGTQKDFFTKLEMLAPKSLSIKNVRHIKRGLHESVAAVKKAGSKKPVITPKVFPKAKKISKSVPKSTSSVTKSAKKQALGSKKESGIFKRDDHDFDEKDYSKDQMRILNFASNCCSYPKLCLYICENTKFGDPHFVCKKINEIFKDTPKEISASDAVKRITG